MAYMLFERVTMSVVDAYRDRADAADELETASRFRAWALVGPLFATAEIVAGPVARHTIFP